MRIIQNKDENHLGEVKDLLANSNEALIASPFISLAAIDKMKNWLTSGFQELTLVTTLKEKDPDQLKKVPVLEELFRLKKTRGFRLTVKIDNQLHGKVYIGKNDVNYTGAIISSANFTENGLENNHEWGIFINDQMTISDIHHQIMNDASIELSENDLKIMRQWMEGNLTEDIKSPIVDVSFINMISPSAAKVTYWLKPLGKSPDPVPANVSFGNEEHKITFSMKGEPSGVLKGDILIAYSVVSQQMLSVFEATEKRGFDKNAGNRWPHYIMCKNQTPTYGANWYQIGLTLNGLRKEFLKRYPSGTVLPSGNKLNGMQWGADHVRATPEFGEFVVRKMKNVEGEG